MLIVEYKNLEKLKRTINLYKSVGTRNADFLFPWLYSIYEKTFLPSVDLKYKDILCLDKTKLTIFDVLVDDLADNSKIRNNRLLQEAVRIPWNISIDYRNQYLNVIKKIWGDCIDSIKKYPRYDDFKDIFYFDLDQVMNSMRYSYLVNTTDFSNFTEDEMYMNHGVMVILHCDMDLMCSPTFNFDEMKNLRPILHWVQDIAHIGNLLNTYPKEIEEADFSSPIISLGIRERLISKNDVVNDYEYTRTSLQPLVKNFEKRMKDNFEKIRTHSSDVKTIDISSFLEKLDYVWDAFINREEYWTENDSRTKFETVKKNNLSKYKLKWIRI